MLNGLSHKYRDVAASIRSLPSSITFPELLDLLDAQERFMDKLDESSTTLTVSANLAHSGSSGKSHSWNQPFHNRGKNPPQGHRQASKPNFKDKQSGPSDDAGFCQWCEIYGHTAFKSRKL